MDRRVLSSLVEKVLTKQHLEVCFLEVCVQFEKQRGSEQSLKFKAVRIIAIGSPLAQSFFDENFVDPAIAATLRSNKLCATDDAVSQKEPAGGLMRSYDSFLCVFNEISKIKLQLKHRYTLSDLLEIVVEEKKEVPARESAALVSTPVSIEGAGLKAVGEDDGADRQDWYCVDVTFGSLALPLYFGFETVAQREAFCTCLSGLAHVTVNSVDIRKGKRMSKDFLRTSPIADQYANTTHFYEKTKTKVAEHTFADGSDQQKMQKTIDYVGSKMQSSTCGASHLFNSISLVTSELNKIVSEQELTSVQTIIENKSRWENAKEQNDVLLKDMAEIKKQVFSYVEFINSQHNNLEETEFENLKLRRKIKNLTRLYETLTSVHKALQLPEWVSQAVRKAVLAGEATSLMIYLNDSDNAATLSRAFVTLQKVTRDPDPKQNDEFRAASLVQASLHKVQLAYQLRQTILWVVKRYLRHGLKELVRLKEANPKQQPIELVFVVMKSFVLLGPIVAALRVNEPEGFIFFLRRYADVMHTFYYSFFTSLFEKLEASVRRLLLKEILRNEFVARDSARLREMNLPASSHQVLLPYAGSQKLGISGDSEQQPLGPSLMGGEFTKTKASAYSLETFEQTPLPEDVYPTSLAAVASKLGPKLLQLPLEKQGVTQGVSGLNEEVGPTVVNQKGHYSRPVSDKAGKEIYVCPNIVFGVALTVSLAAIRQEELVITDCFGLRLTDQNAQEMSLPPRNPEDTSAVVLQARFFSQDETMAVRRLALREIFAGDALVMPADGFSSSNPTSFSSGIRRYNRDIDWRFLSASHRAVDPTLVEPSLNGPKDSASEVNSDVVSSEGGVVPQDDFSDDDRNLDSQVCNKKSIGQTDSFRFSGSEVTLNEGNAARKSKSSRKALLHRNAIKERLYHLARVCARKCDRVYTVSILCMLEKLMTNKVCDDKHIAQYFPWLNSEFTQNIIKKLHTKFYSAYRQFIQEQIRSITVSAASYVRSSRHITLLPFFSRLPFLVDRLDATLASLDPAVVSLKYYNNLLIEILSNSFDALENVATSLSRRGNQNELVQLPAAGNLSSKAGSSCNREQLHPYSVSKNTASVLHNAEGLLLLYRHHAFFCRTYALLPEISKARGPMTIFFSWSATERDMYEKSYIFATVYKQHFSSLAALYPLEDSVKNIGISQLIHQEKFEVKQLFPAVSSLSRSELDVSATEAAKTITSLFTRGFQQDNLWEDFNRELIKSTWKHLTDFLLSEVSALQKIIAREEYKNSLSISQNEQEIKEIFSSVRLI